MFKRKGCTQTEFLTSMFSSHHRTSPVIMSGNLSHPGSYLERNQTNVLVLQAEGFQISRSFWVLYLVLQGNPWGKFFLVPQVHYYNQYYQKGNFGFSFRSMVMQITGNDRKPTAGSLWNIVSNNQAKHWNKALVTGYDNWALKNHCFQTS